jgi:predicted DNA binding CopG/RHH family protein
MKYYELDDYEKEILDDYEKGKFKPLPKAKLQKELARYQAYAKAMMDKTKNINIRISEGDLLKIKALALRQGLPYQTLISSVIHQHSNNQK